MKYFNLQYIVKKCESFYVNIPLETVESVQESSEKKMRT